MGETDSLEFRVLGPLEVVRGAESVAPSAAKQRALLALLLLNANSVVSSDRLIDELWGEEAPASVQSALQVHVSQLRRRLEPKRDTSGSYELILTRPPGYMLRIASDQLDLHRFAGTSTATTGHAPRPLARRRPAPPQSSQATARRGP
jgi:DNA-binding SARP family transcriptional activator